MPKERSEPGPGFVNFHGGGFFLGDLEIEHPRWLFMAAEAGAVSVGVDYRLAPENPFPAGVEDCYAALQWVEEYAAELKIDPTRIAIGGCSAGGGKRRLQQHLEPERQLGAELGRVKPLVAVGVDGVVVAWTLIFRIADAVAIGHSAMMALNCNKDIPESDYEQEMGVEAGYCYHCHTGRCPVGVATQDPKLRKRLDPDKAAERVYNFLHCLAIECQMMARACGKTNVHSLEPEDLAALTMEASALAMVPLAGSQHTVGRPDMTRY